jgi:hypothetical protein
MRRPSLLSDELVQHLVAVGQVDILVGVPTLDNASTVAGVVRAVHTSFSTHYLRERTVLINSDGGSRDGTPEIVRGASLRDDETLIASDSLRTIHRISAPYRGVPGKGAAVRTLFAAADLVQARVVAVFDPDLTSISPDWVPALVGPVWNGEADLVVPSFPRHPLEAPLVTQLVRPLVRGAYARRLSEPVAGEFACSGAFAARCLREPVWEAPLAQEGIELWLPLEALAAGQRVVEAALGPRAAAARPGRPGLPEVFRQVVGSLFACLEKHEQSWQTRGRSERLPLLGTPARPAGVTGGTAAPQPMVESFRAGVRDLAPLLEQILEPSTWQEVKALSEEMDAPRFGDVLWAAIVCQAAGAHRRALMHREHLVQALVPLYLGRVASFSIENAGAAVEAIEARLEDLERTFESARPDLLRGWAERTSEVSHG